MTLGNVAPGYPARDARYHGPSDPEVQCKIGLRNSTGCVARSDLAYLIHSKRASAPPLNDHINHILGFSPLKQMLFSLTGRVVTGMTGVHAGEQWAPKFLLKSEDMCSNVAAASIFSATYTQRPVALVITGACPRMTTLGGRGSIGLGFVAMACGGDPPHGISDAAATSSPACPVRSTPTAGHLPSGAVFNRAKQGNVTLREHREPPTLGDELRAVQPAPEHPHAWILP